MIDPTGISRDDRVQVYLAEAMGISGSLVIPNDDLSDNSTPAPNDPFASYGEISETAVGVDNRRYRNHETDQTLMTFTLRGIREVVYSVQAFRAGSRDRIRRLLSYHLTPLGQLALDRANIVFKSASEVRKISEIISDDWEERFGVDITFSIADVVTQDVNAIASIPIQINKSDGVDYNESLEVQ